jgi:hypothetical protein
MKNKSRRHLLSGFRTQILTQTYFRFALLPAWSVDFLTDGCEKLYNNSMAVLDPFRSSAVRYGL